MSNNEQEKYNIVEHFLNDAGYKYEFIPNYVFDRVTNSYVDIIKLTDKMISIESEYMMTPSTNYQFAPVLKIIINGNHSNKIVLAIEDDKLYQALREAFMYMELNGIIRDKKTLRRKLKGTYSQETLKFIDTKMRGML